MAIEIWKIDDITYSSNSITEIDMNVKEINTDGMIFTLTNNSFTMKTNSRINIGAYTCKFTADETLSLPISNAADTTYYFYLTRNAETKTMKFEFGTSLPSGSFSTSKSIEIFRYNHKAGNLMMGTDPKKTGLTFDTDLGLVTVKEQVQKRNVPLYYYYDRLVGEFVKANGTIPMYGGLTIEPNADGAIWRLLFGKMPSMKDSMIKSIEAYCGANYNGFKSVGEDSAAKQFVKYLIFRQSTNDDGSVTFHLETNVDYLNKTYLKTRGNIATIGNLFLDQAAGKIEPTLNDPIVANARKNMIHDGSLSTSAQKIDITFGTLQIQGFVFNSYSLRVEHYSGTSPDNAEYENFVGMRGQVINSADNSIVTTRYVNFMKDKSGYGYWCYSRDINKFIQPKELVVVSDFFNSDGTLKTSFANKVTNASTKEEILWQGAWFGDIDQNLQLPNPTIPWKFINFVVSPYDGTTTFAYRIENRLIPNLEAFTNFCIQGSTSSNPDFEMGNKTFDLDSNWNIKGKTGKGGNNSKFVLSKVSVWS